MDKRPSQPKLQAQSKLQAQYDKAYQAVFTRFRLGISLFFSGLVFLYIIHQMIEPSLMQEIGMLICALLMGAGFIIAIASEILMLWHRFVFYFRSK